METILLSQPHFSIYCLSLGEIFTDEGGLGFQWASDLSERNKLWKARHNCLYAAMNLRPGTKVWVNGCYVLWVHSHVEIFFCLLAYIKSTEYMLAWQIICWISSKSWFQLYFIIKKIIICMLLTESLHDKIWQCEYTIKSILNPAGSFNRESSIPSPGLSCLHY